MNLKEAKEILADINFDDCDNSWNEAQGVLEGYTHGVKAAIKVVDSFITNAYTSDTQNEAENIKVYLLELLKENQ